ncbi:predicted protein [Nematostella vectensis]|uniref:G-protein coupled receptors family 1 profile domain-containing protein n=1 Tax=Nematostella vectensis TaxID=45351 RepID=A7RKW8_NEMVE|nr:melatonin receptor type 1B-B [Nematostella vectensis]XP_032220921.1 melatonin receptor type 1B-B [Nematostella vectensis]XP_032220922.1 melatonin receptor type 1B-B [Nematostella vectensis]EDO47832.1 predicted protein [Nematostella vectensis]|eukprot:XP_001639895.1 predicted protein [Nematostella vectensis]
MKNTTAVDPLFTELQSRPDAQIWAESIFYVIINVIALFGNLLVCWIFYRNSRLRTVTNIYIMALALSDVATSSFCMPLVAGVLLAGVWPFTKTVCKVHGYLVLFLAFISLHTIALTAVNRYYRVVKAEKFKRMFTKKNAMYSIVIVAGVAGFLVALPLFAGIGHFEFHPGKMTCSIEFYTRRADFLYSGFLVLVIVFSPFVTIIYCYSKVFKAVESHRRRLSLTIQASQDTRLSVEEVNVTKTLFAIVLGFSVCWIPVFIIEFVDATFGEHGLPRPVYLVHAFLVSISAAINPIIYGIMNKTFRGEYRKIFCLCAPAVEVGDIRMDELRRGTTLHMNNTRLPRPFTPRGAFLVESCQNSI